MRHLRCQNLEAFGASVVEAAISCEDGMGWFEFSSESNLGRLGEGGSGRKVELRSMNRLVASLPNQHIDLLKIDIEGGEQALLERATLNG